MVSSNTFAFLFLHQNSHQHCFFAPTGDCPDNMALFTSMARAAMHGKTVASHHFKPALANGVLPNVAKGRPWPAVAVPLQFVGNVRVYRPAAQA